MKLISHIIFYILFFVSFNQSFATVETNQNRIEMAPLNQRSVEVISLQRKAEANMVSAFYAQGLCFVALTIERYRTVDPIKARWISRKR